MKKQKRKVVLLGEGIHQHTLYGEFTTDEGTSDFATVTVEKPTELRHESPTRHFAEHETLILDKGKWVQGLQVEYNPFDQKVSRVWD